MSGLESDLYDGGMKGRGVRLWRRCIRV